jgi:hypothetical protein
MTVTMCRNLLVIQPTFGVVNESPLLRALDR